MRVAVIGTGYVGLVSGTCFAEFGIDVTCVDLDQDKIKRLQKGDVPIYEPGLGGLLARQIDAKRIHFTCDTAAAVKDADAVFIAVGTPPRESDGHADLTYVYDAAREIARHITGYTVIVNKSTVPVGTARAVEQIIRSERPDADFDVASNPEFLREGVAVSDFMRPDRVVIGTASPRAQAVLREIYKPLAVHETPIVFTSCETAEIIKYAANAFLATKIAFINEIADLCEVAGGDVRHVARAMGLDDRIGPKFLAAGPGYGGSCFPKDTMALTHTGRVLNAPQRIVEAVVKVNEDRQNNLAARIIAACGGSVAGKRIGILGVAFKPHTDDVREAPSLTIIPALQGAGATIAAFDPAAMDKARAFVNDVEWMTGPYEVAAHADALVIVTEWSEFRALDFTRLAATMRTRRLIDFRNVYETADMAQAGFHYVSVGRVAVGADGAAPQAAARKISGV